MPIDPKININENQVIFKRDVGHKHDGLTSSLIDYTKYSLFDFLPAVRASGGARLNFQVANERSLKTFIVDAVEERVLNPQGIRIQANTITANEIAVGTITANELVRDFIMVNNTMKSNNYSEGSAGWKISNTGEAEFNNVVVRGNVQANVGTIGNILITSSTVQSSDYDGSNGFALYSNGFADFNEVSVRGEIIALSGSITDNFSIGSNVQIGGFANIGANATVGSDLTIGTSATIGGSLTIGNNIRINGATADNSQTVFKIRSDSGNLTSNFIVKFQNLSGDVFSVRNDGRVTMDGPLLVNGATVTTGGPYLPTAGGTLTGALTANASVTVNDQVFISASLGTAETSPALRVNRSYDADGGYFIEFTNTSGTVQAGRIRYVIGDSQAVAYLSGSDIRLKNIIDKSVDGISVIRNLNPVHYQWKNGKGGDYFGFIAQELYEVIPNAVSPGDTDDVFYLEDGRVNVEEPWAIEMSGIVPYLVKAMQELLDKNDELEARLQAVEGV